MNPLERRLAALERREPRARSERLSDLELARRIAFLLEQAVHCPDPECDDCRTALKVASILKAQTFNEDENEQSQ